MGPLPPREGGVGMDRQLNMKTMKFAAAFHCNMHAIRVPTTIERESYGECRFCFSLRALVARGLAMARPTKATAVRDDDRC